MLLIKNADLYTMEKQDPLCGFDLLLCEGKIAAIGQGLSDVGAQVLDATGLCALPGLIDAHSHVGAYRLTGLSDHSEKTDPVTPQLDIYHSMDINDPVFRALPASGITSCCFIPGSANVVCGQGFVGKTWGKNLAEMTVLRPAAMKCAMGGNPKNQYGPRNMAPSTRMGIAYLLRDALLQTKLYLEQREQQPYNAKWEAMIPVLKGEIPLKVHCEQFDMLTVIDIAQEFGCRYTIEHGWDCRRYAKELAAGGGDVMFGPIGMVEGYGEVTGRDVGEVIELDRLGINVSLITDSPILGADLLLISAGEAVRRGLPHQRALAMITINPAKALGLAQRLGSLAVGKDADIVLYRGIPALDMAARLCYTLVNGQIAYQAAPVPSHV